MSESMRERPPCSIKDGCGKSRVCSEGVLTKTQNRLISSATANYAPFCKTSCRSSKPARSSSELRDAMPSVNSPGFAKRPVSNGLPVSVMKGTCKTPFSGSSNLKGLKGWNVVAGPARGVYNSVSDAFPQESAQSYRDSQPAPVTKTPHPISTAERALLVGVGWVGAEGRGGGGGTRLAMGGGGRSRHAGRPREPGRNPRGSYGAGSGVASARISSSFPRPTSVAGSAASRN